MPLKKPDPQRIEAALTAGAASFKPLMDAVRAAAPAMERGLREASKPLSRLAAQR